MVQFQLWGVQRHKTSWWRTYLTLPLCSHVSVFANVALLGVGLGLGFGKGTLLSLWRQTWTSLAMPPHPSDVGAMPSHQSTTFGATPPKSSVFVTTDGDELQQLQNKTRTKTPKNPQIHGLVNHLQRWQECKGIKEGEHYWTQTISSLTKHCNNFTRRFKKRMDWTMTWRPASDARFPRRKNELHTASWKTKLLSIAVKCWTEKPLNSVNVGGANEKTKQSSMCSWEVNYLPLLHTGM